MWHLNIFKIVILDLIMVFGWGKKKPKKQEPEIAPQKKQILLSDVPNVVDEIRSIRTKTIIAETKTFKNKIKLKNIRKNDLIFWKGHVAVATSKNSLIHAYGPFKKVVIMPIKKTINRIYETANLKVIGIRRIG